MSHFAFALLKKEDKDLHEEKLLTRLDSVQAVWKLINLTNISTVFNLTVLLDFSLGATQIFGLL